MKKYVKPFCLLVAILLTLNLTIPYASATAYYNNEASVFQISHLPFSVQSIVTQMNRVSLCGLPSTTDYNYIWFSLEDSSGSEIYREIAARNSEGNTTFSLPAYLDGTYKIIAYQSSERYATYHVFLYGISAQISGGAIHIVESPAYAGNLAHAQKETNSPNALSFYLRPSVDIQSDNTEILARANAITDGLDDDYAKALAIHDWVCDHIAYDFDVLYQRSECGDTSAIGTLKSGRSVCEGYTNLTVALLRAAGIPAKKVSGYALGATAENAFPADALNGTCKTNHAWNEAYVNGRWIIMDTTWDSDNDYEYGRMTSAGGCYSHLYYDISQDLFAQTHAVIKSRTYSEMSLYLDYPEYWTSEGWKPISATGIAPIVKNGRTLVPIRAIIEEMGGTVEYTPATERYLARITCQTDDFFAQMWIGSRTLWVNDEELEFDVMPQVVNGHTMVPVSTLLKAMGCTVIWDPSADNWHGKITIGYAA